ncbi:eukaryotic translation initiation factor 5 [Maublancomyces gigas]|uniref:Eukaryotic translation initiation factor 5 n=1 Tax=Discina gigas TaxID=1032678 RepID=A0ABR3G762_9PEZI
MERLQSKIEGKGNGIKSVIVNLSSVAHSLSRDPAYVVKFFGFELGAQVTANPTDDRYIINGAHDATKLQEYLDTFINKFVLCKQCKNPETDLIVQKDGSILRDCKACGQRTDVENRHKLSSYIVKNPPKREKRPKISSSKKSKKSNGEGENGNSPKDSGSEDHNGDVDADGGSDDELTKRINAEAKELAANGDAPEVKDDEWAVDMSEEAIKARAKNLPDDLKRALVIEGEDDDEAEGANNPYDQLGSWIVAQKKENAGEIDDIEVYKKTQELGIEKKHKTLQVLAQTLFDENIIKKNQVKKHAGLLKKMITSDRHQKAFLGGTERFVGKDCTKLIPTIPTILMAYYENDLATEETITKWGSRASKKYVDVQTSKKVRKAAEPFLKWLEEADEDGSDNGEEDEDEDDDGDE